MPFHTRDFRELFGFEHTTIQYLLQNQFIQPVGPPPKGRGSRRSYGLDAAFRIGLISRLRRAGMEIPASNRFVDFAQRFFQIFTENTRPDHLLLSQLKEFRPFERLHSEGQYEFFIEIIDYEWITILVGDREAAHISKIPWAFSLNPKSPPEISEQKKPLRDLEFADLRLQANLTSIARAIAGFVQQHPHQFPELTNDIQNINIETTE
jgi:hypothetical protein